MPDPNDPEARAARRREMEAIQSRGGRAAMNMEMGSAGGTIAGGAYSKTKLG